MKKKKTKITVCIITYNHEKFLRQCLDGAINQELDENWDYEIIIGEDHSTDNTLQICREYKEKYRDLITLLERPKNLGLIGNWINTLGACNGDYIALCEGDDYWSDSKKLQKQVNFMEEHPSFSMCATKTQRVNERGEKGENTGKKYGEITHEEVLRQNQFGTCTVMLRSKFLKVPFFENIDGFFGADWPLWCYMLSKGPGYNLKDLTATYHVHEGGATSGRNKAKTLQNKLEDRMLMINNFPEKKKVIKNYGVRIIINYLWKSALFQNEYYKAIISNRKLILKFLSY